MRQTNPPASPDDTAAPGNTYGEHMENTMSPRVLELTALADAAVSTLNDAVFDEISVAIRDEFPGATRVRLYGIGAGAGSDVQNVEVDGKTVWAEDWMESEDPAVDQIDAFRESMEYLTHRFTRPSIEHEEESDWYVLTNAL